MPFARTTPRVKGNRLAKVQSVSGGDSTTVAAYEYYGDNRRSEKIVQNQGAEAVDHDGGDTTVRYYYDSQWRIVETRNGSAQTTYQYVWGTKYTDELILIDNNLGPTTDNDGDADFESTAELTQTDGDPLREDARYLVHQDRNWNVIALSDYDPDSTANDPVIVERYSYTPYGRFVVLRGDSSGDQLGNVLLTSAVGNVFAYRGRPMDHKKGSYQSRNQKFGAPIQRFTVTHPFGGGNYRDARQPGDPQAPSSSLAIPDLGCRPNGRPNSYTVCQCASSRRGCSAADWASLEGLVYAIALDDDSLCFSGDCYVRGGRACVTMHAARVGLVYRTDSIDDGCENGRFCCVTMEMVAVITPATKH